MTSVQEINAMLAERKRIVGIINNATYLTIEQQDLLLKKVRG